jgi:organic hydroperoxide reductase OsmC/OhrA
MWTYQTSVNWTTGKTGVLCGENKPEIPVAAPPEFGGPQEGYWTPEYLVAAAAGSCIMTTALFFTGRENIGLSSYESRANAVMEKTPSGLAITGITIDVTAALENPEQEPALRKALERAEQNCPVSALFKCPVRLSLNITR